MRLNAGVSISILVLILFIIGCATKVQNQKEEPPAQVSAGETKAETAVIKTETAVNADTESREPELPGIVDTEPAGPEPAAAVEAAMMPAVEKPAEPVMAVVREARLISETAFFPDGTVDFIRRIDYPKNSVLPATEKTVSADETPQSTILYRYNDDGVLVEKSILDENGAVRQRIRLAYDDSGDPVRETMLDDRDRVVTESIYEYNDGRKTLWKIFDGNGVLLSATEYEYETDGMTRIQSYNPEGVLEEYFLIDYADGLPVKSRHYNAGGTLQDSVDYEIRDGQTVGEIHRRGNGSVSREVEYSYDKDGNIILVYYRSSGAVTEYARREYDYIERTEVVSPD